MQKTDIVIIGGGLAGSIAAAMLGNAGIDTVLVDPHPIYPPDFRCEKLDGPQVGILKKTGLADSILQSTTPDHDSWVVRFGRVTDKRPGDQQGILYGPLVNTIRNLVPNNVTRMFAKATAVTTSNERQKVTLSNGEELSARLIVLANGLNMSLRHTLGLTRDILSECHSIAIGFDVKTTDRCPFQFSSLTYYADTIADRTAYLTLFPIGTTMRANLFVYRDQNDPWLQEFRTMPHDILLNLMPGLRSLMGNFEVEGPVKIRPIDLYATRGHRQAGFVLVGDAFATSCPAAGTGARKALTDVERLCNHYIPRWLGSPGMGKDKIEAFYDDPIKAACDEFSFAKAHSLRSFSTSAAFSWRARRRSKFLLQSGLGAVRRFVLNSVSLRENRNPLAATPNAESKTLRRQRA
jgi:2-polyprenyl-6-methoxyphenol hydroxylase-like FAD-dependent oxidoreductase